MEYLSVDEQTIKDLGIFEKPGKPSIYDLYNKTATQGGAARMAELFKAPLADATVINERSRLYHFFNQQEYRFPVDPGTVAAVAFYLENDDIRSQLQAGSHTLGQKFKGLVAADPDQIFVRDGVMATIRLFNLVCLFLKNINEVAQGSPFETQYKKIDSLLTDTAFAPLRSYMPGQYDPKTNVEPKLNLHVLGELDKLIRFEQREQSLLLLQFLYDIDVSIAVGQVARSRNFHFAKAIPKDFTTLHYEKVYHPYVENAVANDLQLDETRNVLFLTGANMAGKSTLMKSIGIALFLGHMGFPVAAHNLTFSVRDAIYTSINLSDNLNQGASHYYAEVLRVKEVAIALNQGGNLFVIFDELFRGTNVKDAYDATIAITKAFAGKKGSQFIISTHIMEAGEVLNQQPLSIHYQFLPTEMNGNKPVYTRILREGITGDRQGMIIIQNEGILEMLDAGIPKKKEVLWN